VAKKKNNDSLTFTYPGVISNPGIEETFILDELMRKFQSGKRFLRERIYEGHQRKDAVHLAKPLFINNSRYMRDAFLEAEAQISSQKELLPIYVEQNKIKLHKLENQIDQLKQSKKKEKEEKMAYKQAKMKKIQKNIHFLEHHIKNNTVPKIVDGSKQRLKRLNKGKMTKEEWRDVRSNELFSRGEKSKGGNENTKLKHVKEEWFELSVLNPLSKKRGDRLFFHVYFPKKFVNKIGAYLHTGEAYSIRLKRKDGKYLVFLTLEEDIQAVPDFSKGMAGMDINPDNLSVTIVYPNGNFKASHVFWMHDINTVSADKRDWIIQNTITEVVDWLKSYGVDSLSIEKLDFNAPSGSKKFNRMAGHFSYRSISKAIVSRCFKEHIALIQVPAYYSSLIGKLKYEKMFGLSIHQAAALVLARRGLGLHEKVPKELLSVLFAKEVKKGQEITDLFTHWKKVKEWYDDTIRELISIKRNHKNLFLKDLIACNQIEIPF
jgi:hypothetical protein